MFLESMKFNVLFKDNIIEIVVLLVIIIFGVRILESKFPNLTFLFNKSLIVSLTYMFFLVPNMFYLIASEEAREDISFFAAFTIFFSAIEMTSNLYDLGEKQKNGVMGLSKYIVDREKVESDISEIGDVCMRLMTEVEKNISSDKKLLRSLIERIYNIYDRMNYKEKELIQDIVYIDSEKSFSDLLCELKMDKVAYKVKYGEETQFGKEEIELFKKRLNNVYEVCFRYEVSMLKIKKIGRIMEQNKSVRVEERNLIEFSTKVGMKGKNKILKLVDEKEEAEIIE